jgi:NAD(P)-dependent dehydrogenase (short-subunit alcohol dehydrogenase family)
MMDKLFDLQGKVALVTGGSGVLGSAICQMLKDAQVQVYILARNQTRAQMVTDRLNASKQPPFAQVLKADVLDKPALEKIANTVLGANNRLDIIINVAGGNHTNATAIPQERSFFDLPQDALQWVFNLNFFGTLLVSQVFGAKLARQQSGVILNISSMASFQPLSRVVAYGAAKAAVNNFTQWLAVYMAQEYSPQIRVNAIAPGFFMGEQNRYLLIDAKTGDLTPRGQQIINHTPQGRFGEPEDLLGAVRWLVSDASRFVTGIVVPVDGGFSAYSGV